MYVEGERKGEKALLRGAKCSSSSRRRTGGRGEDSGEQLEQYRNNNAEGTRYSC